jgi:hypothetical protein
MSIKTPTLEQVIKEAIERKSASIRVCLPGRVEKFDAEKQLANVKPLIQEVYEDEDESTFSSALPVIPNVPVVFEGTSNFYMTYPIQAGDRCMIVFNDLDYDAWMTNGDDNAPSTSRRHDLTDAVCIMGMRDQGHKISEFDANRPAIGKQGGPRITFEDGAINIGADHNETPSDFAALASKVTAALDDIKNAFNNHVHSNGNNGAPTGTPQTAAQTPASISASTDVAAQKVKVQ